MWKIKITNYCEEDNEILFYVLMQTLFIFLYFGKVEYPKECTAGFMKILRYLIRKISNFLDGFVSISLKFDNGVENLTTILKSRKGKGFIRKLLFLIYCIS